MAELTREDVIKIVQEVLSNSTQRIKINSNQIQSSDYKSGSRGWAIMGNGDVEFNAGTFRGDLLIGGITGPAVSVDASSGAINMLFDNSIVGTISGRGTTHGLDVFRLELSTSDDRHLYFGGSGLYVDGDLYPIATLTNSIGNTNNVWDNIYGNSIVAWGANAKFSINGDDGVNNGSFTVVTSVDFGAQTYGTHSLKIEGGIITST
jgi:hypothetical protein